MFIKLQWNNPNKGIDVTTFIYRSVNPFGVDMVGAERIASVPPGVTEYIDNTVLIDKQYYYRLVFNKPGYNSAISDIFRFTCNRYGGDRKGELLYGTDEFGLRTRYNDEEFTPNVNDVRHVFGLGPIEEQMTITYFYEFVVNNKLRYALTLPIASGKEIPIDNEIIQTLKNGGEYTFNKGLHSWSMVLPKTLQGTVTTAVSYPGELTSILSVVTDVYAPIRMGVVNNTLGNRVSFNDGLTIFYAQLSRLYPSENIENILTVDWDNTDCTVISWTPEEPVGDIKPKEFINKKITLTAGPSWDSTLIWPIFTYNGLSNDN